MLDKLKYYICVIIDWKIFVLSKLRDKISNTKKYSLLPEDWVTGYNEWKKRNKHD
jgi:hypothetical protein